jgi:hypothetical protein
MVGELNEYLQPPCSLPIRQLPSQIPATQSLHLHSPRPSLPPLLLSHLQSHAQTFSIRTNERGKINANKTKHKATHVPGSACSPALRSSRSLVGTPTTASSSSTAAGAALPQCLRWERRCLALGWGLGYWYPETWQRWPPLSAAASFPRRFSSVSMDGAPARLSAPAMATATAANGDGGANTKASPLAPFLDETSGVGFGCGVRGWMTCGPLCSAGKGDNLFV